jgi:hypothetical protein
MLGIPWTKEQGAVYYMNNNTYSKYSVPHKSKTYNLLSMDTMKYKVWRDEKLQQFKKEEETKIKQKADVQFRVHEEAKNMEAEEVALLPAPFIPSRMMWILLLHNWSYHLPVTLRVLQVTQNRGRFHLKKGRMIQQQIHILLLALDLS